MERIDIYAFFLFVKMTYMSIHVDWYKIIYSQFVMKYMEMVSVILDVKKKENKSDQSPDNWNR